MNKSIHKTPLAVSAAAALLLALPSISSAQKFAVWLNGQTTSGGNPIVANLDTQFGAGAAQLVTTAQLDTPGFLNSFQAVVVSRFDTGPGAYLDATAAANIAAYVGAPGPSQGGVALFPNNMAQNLSGGPDPFSPNLQALFSNAAKYVAASGHGYLGELNGAVQAMSANTAGAAAMGLLAGTADAPGPHGAPFEQFVYGVGPAGLSNPIDAGATFPFTEIYPTTDLTDITGAAPSDIVSIFTDPKAAGDPAMLANSFVTSGGVAAAAGAPEVASTWLLLSIGLASLFGLRLAVRRFGHA